MKGLVLALLSLIGVGGLSYALLYNGLRLAANRVKPAGCTTMTGFHICKK